MGGCYENGSAQQQQMKQLVDCGPWDSLPGSSPHATPLLLHHVTDYLCADVGFDQPADAVEVVHSPIASPLICGACK